MPAPFSAFWKEFCAGRQYTKKSFWFGPLKSKGQENCNSPKNNSHIWPFFISYISLYCGLIYKALVFISVLLLICFLFIYNGWLFADKARVINLSGQPFTLRTPEIRQKGVARFCYPVKAADFLAKYNKGSKILTDLPWNFYFLWRLGPKFKDAVDARGKTVFPDYIRALYYDFIFYGPDWDTFLKKYRPDIIAIQTDSATASALIAHPGWNILYQDDCCTLFNASSEHF